MAVNAAEIIPRPLTGEGLLVLETSRMMLPLRDREEAVFCGVVNGHSKERIVDENELRGQQLATAMNSIQCALDARTWSEATRIAVELGVVAVMPAKKGDQSITDEELLTMQDASSRGLRLIDIRAKEGYSINEATRYRSRLIQRLGVPNDAYMPDAAATYQWYARGYGRVPDASEDRLRLLLRLQNMRHLLHFMYKGVGFDKLPDEPTAQFFKEIGGILVDAEVKQGSVQYDRIIQFLSTGRSWAAVAAEAQIDPSSITTMLHRVREGFHSYTDAAGILVRAGVDISLPIQIAPPLSRGLGRPRTPLKRGRARWRRHT